MVPDDETRMLSDFGGVAWAIAGLAASFTMLVAVILLNRRHRRLSRSAKPSSTTDAWAEAGRRMKDVP